MRYTIEKISITQLENELCEAISEKIKETTLDVDGDQAKGKFDFIHCEGEELELHVVGEYIEGLIIIPDTFEEQGSVEVMNKGCIDLDIYAVLNGEVVEYCVGDLSRHDFERSVDDETSRL